MANVDQARLGPSNWQQISLTHLKGREHWTVFFRIVLFTPVLWIHVPIFEYMAKGTIYWQTLSMTGTNAIMLSGSISAAMLFMGRHRLNLFGWIAVSGLVGLLIVLVNAPRMTNPMQGLVETMGLSLAANMCVGGLAWMLGVRLLPWIGRQFNKS